MTGAPPMPTATSPSDAQAAAQVLANLLASMRPPTGRVGNLLAQQDRRIRKALTAAQRALAEPGVRNLSALADDLGSSSMRAAADQVAQARALAAVRRSYRHP